ncbi:MAG: hypothetical protein LBI02_06530 [Opitutaceae bacterium]|jgi:hypothetical protein|nr:hypothetical protein [Opitutaceae bacterium]
MIFVGEKMGRFASLNGREETFSHWDTKKRDSKRGHASVRFPLSSLSFYSAGKGKVSTTARMAEIAPYAGSPMPRRV